MIRMLNRRALLTAMATTGAASLLAACSSGESELEPGTLDLGWQDLLPEEGGTAIDRTSTAGGEVQHGEIQLASGYTQPASSGAVEALNNERVRIPGFMLPVVQVAEGVTSFLLVPYVGACIHVPPPPSNQIVFVTCREPYGDGSLYEPIRVTGMLEITTIDTDLAQVGYMLDAEQIERYTEQLS